MSGVSGLVFFVALIIVCIVFSTKAKVNLGITALFLAFLAGGVVLDMSASQVVALFPTSLFFIQTIVCLLFGFALSSGAFKKLAHLIIYKSGGNARVIPFLLLVAGLAVACLGGGPEATPVIMSPLCFSIAVGIGMNPLMASLLTWVPSWFSAQLPHIGSGAMLYGIIGGVYPEWTSGSALGINIIHAVLVMVVFIVVYFLCKTHKLSGHMDLEKPEPFTREEKIVLQTVVAVIVILLLPAIINAFAPNPVTAFISRHFEIRLLSCFGAIYLQLRKVDTIPNVVKNYVPWNTILMICGMSTMVNLASGLGVMDTVSGFIGTAIPAHWVPFAVVLFGGLLSMVTSGTAIWPIFISLAPGLIEATGMHPLAIIIPLMLSVNVTSFSPLSTGGAMAFVGATEEQRKEIFGKQYLVCVGMLILYLVFAAVGGFVFIANLVG